MQTYPTLRMFQFAAGVLNAGTAGLLGTFLHTEFCATVSLTMSSVAWTLRGQSTEILT